jgi:Flp pilus assembly protein TadG
MPPVRAGGRQKSGNAVVEFAVGFTMLWLMFTGVYQFGYTLYLYENLRNAITDGAAFAARNDFNASAPDTFAAQVKNMVVYGSPAGGTTALVPNLTTSMVSVTWTSDSAGVTQTITVSISSYSASALFNSFVFRNKPSCTVKYMGTFLT